MADLLTLLNTDVPVRQAAARTVAVLPKLIVMAIGNPYGNPFTFLNNQFTTIIMDTVAIDSANGYSTSTGIYTVPETGVYEFNGKMRLSGVPANTSYGLGMHTSNQDNPSFFWTNTNGNREGIFNSRLVSLNQGDPMRLYAYLDTSGGYGVISAEMNAVRVG